MASHTQNSRGHVISKRTFTANKDDKTKDVIDFGNKNVTFDQNSATSNTRCSTSLEQNGMQKQNRLPINQNFSSRNSLRSAQSFTRSNINHSNQMLFPAEKIAISELEVCNNFIPDSNSEADSKYEVLTSDGFLRLVNEANQVYLYCMLCGRKERMQSRSAVELHLTCDDHNSNLFSLRNRLLDQTPSSTSLQMNALAALLITWYDSNALTSDNIHGRLEIIHQFNTVLDMVNPECKLRILGSLAVGTSLFSSDINLELIHPNSRLFEKDPRAKNSIHHKLIDPDAQIGSQINNHTLHYDLIPNAIDTLYTTMKVISTINQDPRLCPFEIKSDYKDLNRKIPRLVLRHSLTKTNLEICCYAGPRYDLSILLNTYLSLDKRARVLSILIKYWSQQCNIDKPEQGTLPSDAFVIMTIYYLQRLNPPILPCLHDLLSKGGTRSESSANQENTLNSAFNKMDLNNFRSRHEVAKESNQSDNLRKADLEPLDIDNGEEELDDEEDEDAGCADLDQEDLKNISWTSSNTTPLPQLFIDFLFMMMKEFDDSSSVITIRTLKKVTLHGKSWVTQVKAIEHPLRPKINISRCIGTVRTFEYIKRCFRYGYYYLTSIPLDTEFKQKQEYQTDPKDYIELYMNLTRFEAYYRMRGPTIIFERSYDSVSELVQQNLFARDITVVNALIDRSKDINFLPFTVANFYQIKLIVPKDVQATVYCTLCRNIGHSRSSCPRAKLENLELESQSYDSSLDSKANFDRNFLVLYKVDEITPRLFRDHELVVSTLTSKINQGTGLKSQLQLFGSTVNNLGSRDSDLDICMTLVDNPTGKGVDCVEVLKSVHQVLDRMPSVEDLEPILSARVPILKFKYEQSYEIDLSMYNLCATYNSKLLKVYSEIDDRVGKLFYLVKKYARGCGIADASRGSLSSYAWSLMVIHYLQRTEPPILPVLQETDGKNEKKLIGVNGWNVWFKENIDPPMESRNNLKITSLFKGFLLYYGNFDFDYYVVSIRKLAPITRFQKSWNHCMMAIEDPFELTYNLASRLDDSMAIYIINSFSLAYRHIVALQEKHIKLNGLSPPPNFVVQKIFNGKEFMGSNPPYRGCRHCHRIGHKLRDCPEKRGRQKRFPKATVAT